MICTFLFANYLVNSIDVTANAHIFSTIAKRELRDLQFPLFGLAPSKRRAETYRF